MQIHEFSQHEVLDDGRPVLVRAIRPDDKDALLEAFSRLSKISAFFRFFREKRTLTPRELEYFTEVDFTTHVAIGVGLLNGEEMTPIAIGRYIVDEDDPQTAEIALTVDDAHQGLGVGSLMLRHLRRIALASGIEEFNGVLLADNQRAMRVLKRSGLPLQTRFEADVIEIRLTLRDDP